MQTVYTENMRVLKIVQPDLYACFADDTHLEHGAEPADHHDEGEEVVLADERPQGKHVVVLLEVQHVDRFTQALAKAQAPLVVIEHRIEVLRACLQSQPLSSWLLQGRLVFFMLRLGDPVTVELSIRSVVGGLMRFLIQGQSIAWILRSHSCDVYGKIAQGIRLNAQRTLQLAHAPSGRPAQWDVTVVSPYCAIFDDLARCFSGLGLKTRVFRVPDRALMWDVDARMKAVQQLKQEPSRLLIGRNRTLFETEQTGDPIMPEQWLAQDYVAWWWDVPNPASYLDFQLPIKTGIQHLAFAHHLLSVLPPFTQWIPAGARPQFVEVDEKVSDRNRIPISFVGQTRLQATYKNWHELVAVLAGMGLTIHLPQLSAEMSAITSYELLQLCKDDLEQVIRRIAKFAPSHAYFLDYSLRMCETGLFRMAAIEQIIKLGLPLKIWGDEDWLKVPGVTTDHYAGVLDPQHLAQVYTQSQVNLNLNYMQVSSTVNPKVLDVAAAGAVVVTDHRPELDVLYPDPACRPLAFNALAELPEVLDFALHHDLEDHSRQIQHYTRQQHTLLQRAEWIARQFHLID